MSISYKIAQACAGQNHGATIIEDATSQKRLGIAFWDPARNQFAFSPDNQDLALSAADQASIVTILNSLSK